MLLAILAIGMLSLSSIALRSSSANSAMEEARANARMALMLALGELQTHLGPDARVSARAETLGKDTRVASPAAANTPEAWWVGVSHSDGKTKLANGRDIAWLLSGAGDGPGSPLDRPVKMIGQGSLDLAAYTGGKPIEAGRVEIKKSSSDNASGAYAWFIDDNGMKAQLGTSHPDVINSNNLSNGVLPAAYDPYILTGNRISGLDPDVNGNLLKINSIRDIPLADMANGLSIVREKFFSYTTRSLGVLSDVKRGGLKKDLTIAFENPDVFAANFPSSDPGKYLLLAPDKLAGASELSDNGYINWSIFRDYYRLKNSFTPEGGIESHAFNKNDLLGGVDAFSRGLVGPHARTGSPRLARHPYRLTPADVIHGGDYVNNPIFSILQMLQENAWVEYQAPQPGIPAKLTTRAQLFVSHYNPYNAPLHVRGELTNQTRGPRVLNYPMILTTVGTAITRKHALDRTKYLQVYSQAYALIPPGRSQVFGFKGNKTSERNSGLYSQNIRDVITDSVYKEYDLPTDLPDNVNVKFEIYPKAPAMMIGADSHPPNGDRDREVSQVFFTPYAWDMVPSGKNVSQNRPGKIFEKSYAKSDLGYNSAVSFQFALKTTQEVDDPIRPLIDGNIRAVWNNPRWDSPLNLSTLATYSADSKGEAPERFVHMTTDASPHGYTYWGSARDSLDGTDRVILFDVPRRDLVSLGQLQHAAAGRFSYEPTYIAANSYANPRLDLGKWTQSISDTFSTEARGLAPHWKIPGRFNLYDASYLVNEVLFDSYTFTTIPQVEDNYGGDDVPADYPALLDRYYHLPNPRFIPYEPAGSTFSAGTLRTVGDATTGSFHHNAGHLLVDGLFNVNSTSVDAWEAFLSGTHQIPVGRVSEAGVIDGFHNTTATRFPRAASHLGAGMDDEYDKFWTGFRELTQYEVREIAEEIVEEIRKRGPFLTLGDFVNRRIPKDPSESPDERAEAGALQAALDRTVNRSIPKDIADEATHAKIPDESTQGTGFPGHLLQGDILQALAPYISVRSDTFTIRAYGEARNVKTGAITATAWCEAVVQRYPDPVPTTTAKPILEEIALPSSPFGRKFSIISFRWLHADEI